MDTLLQRYLENALYILLAAGSEAIDELEFADEDEDTAKLQVVIRFSGGSRLNVGLRVSIFDDFPRRRAYSFHYMTGDGETIFRYDNAKHHPGLPHSPHHKHEGPDNRVSGCRQPSLRDIRDEIAAYLE